MAVWQSGKDARMVLTQNMIFAGGTGVEMNGSGNKWKKQGLAWSERLKKRLSLFVWLFLSVCLTVNGVLCETQAASTPRMIAHMGYCTKAPANTLAAFTEAGKAGFWGIEADIKETRDGVLVCSHEDSLSAVTNGRGYIYRKRYSYIKKLRVTRGSGRRKYQKERIPRLEQYLDVCRKYGCVAVLDLKYSSVKAAQNAYKAVVKRDMLEQTIFQSSVISYLRAIRKLDKDAQLWYLVKNITPTTIRTARGLKCKCINSLYITASAIKKAHKNHLQVCCWISTSRSTNKRYKRYSIDYIMENKLL